MKDGKVWRVSAPAPAPAPVEGKEIDREKKLKMICSKVTRELYTLRMFSTFDAVLLQVRRTLFTFFLSVQSSY